MQEHLFRHFSSPDRNGFLNDASITFIDKKDPSDPLKREDYRRRTLKTIAPFRLTNEDSVWSVIIVINGSVVITIYLAFRSDVVLDCFKDCDFWMMDRINYLRTVSADFRMRNRVGYTKSWFAEDLRCGKLGGEACILLWVYLFICLLFVYLLPVCMFAF